MMWEKEGQLLEPVLEHLRGAGIQSASGGSAVWLLRASVSSSVKWDSQTYFVPAVRLTF